MTVLCLLLFLFSGATLGAMGNETHEDLTPRERIRAAAPPRASAEPAGKSEPQSPSPSPEIRTSNYQIQRAEKYTWGSAASVQEVLRQFGIRITQSELAKFLLVSRGNAPARGAKPWKLIRFLQRLGFESRYLPAPLDLLTASVFLEQGHKIIARIQKNNGYDTRYVVIQSVNPVAGKILVSDPRTGETEWRAPSTLGRTLGLLVVHAPRPIELRLPRAFFWIKPQEQRYWCWASAIQSVLGQKGYSISQWRLRKMLYGRSVMDRDGAGPEKVVSLFLSLGVKARYRPFPPSFGNLRRLIAQGKRIIVRVQYRNKRKIGRSTVSTTHRHYVIFQAIDPRTGKIAITNPSGGSTLWMTLQDIPKRTGWRLVDFIQVE